MAKKFKLNAQQKQKILGWGYEKNEFAQIEDCANLAEIINRKTNRRISWMTALKKLGETPFLTGICRAAFHWTAIRNNEDESEEVYFNNSNYFK